MTSDQRVDTFLENAVKAGAGTRRVSDATELNAAVSELVSAAPSVYCPEVTDTERALEVPQEKRVEDYRSAAVTVEEVSGAIAEIGCVICSSEGGKALQAGLLPVHHIAVVRSDRIYTDLDDFFASLSDTLPTNITLITGPSRTADIELTLTVGVHGPERLDVIVV